jgi:hypothetical protein
MANSPVVKLHHNPPWVPGISTSRWRDILRRTVQSTQEQIAIWHKDGMLDREHDSLTIVLLSPARRDNRASAELSQLVTAVLLVGPRAREFAPAALSAADVHYQHRMPLQEMIENCPHLLPGGCSLTAYSAKDRGVIAGGAGLPRSELVIELLTRELECLIDNVITELRLPVERGEAQFDSSKANGRYVRICDEIFNPTPE